MLVEARGCRSKSLRLSAQRFEEVTTLCLILFWRLSLRLKIEAKAKTLLEIR